MDKIAAVNDSTTDELWEEVAPKLEDAPSLEGAAQKFLDSVYEKFGVNLALTRVFLTVPYGDLPPAKQEWVNTLAKDNGVGEELHENTPVLSLVGTRGEEWAWNEVGNSKGHIGIPLVSPSFVDAIPMVSRLLGDLGLGADLGEFTEGGMEIRTVGPSFKTFYVEDAHSSVDDKGRKIIPGQDFVEQYGIKTVFGVGGPYGEGLTNMLVCILFTKEEIQKHTAQLFEPLIENFRDITRDFVVSENIFS